MLSILVWRRVKVLFNVPAVLAHAVGQTVSVRLGVSSSSWTNKATLCSKQTYRLHQACSIAGSSRSGIIAADEPHAGSERPSGSTTLCSR